MPDGRCQNHVEIDVRVLEAITSFEQLGILGAGIPVPVFL